ncbi:hypothetical protein Acr_00g0053060 [Actinidia rufa]|uniref:Uncharacterized protein n=1 Tax=Actinidia rufa TaxID=165716 RepID=A0A7J0DLI1_9ERIC|nr:hypothetical protein Acr_00g0053060 [Actinidia rufa]
MSNQMQRHQQADPELDPHQQAMTELRLVGHEQQQVLDQFPFYGEAQPTSVLDLANVSLQLHTYQLQPTQPNLQDLAPPNYGTH